MDFAAGQTGVPIGMEMRGDTRGDVQMVQAIVRADPYAIRAVIIDAFDLDVAEGGCRDADESVLRSVVSRQAANACAYPQPAGTVGMQGSDVIVRQRIGARVPSAAIGLEPVAIEADEVSGRPDPDKSIAILRDGHHIFRTDRLLIAVLAKQFSRRVLPHSLGVRVCV
ncbi:MAG: hypothetical protein PW843_09725 [Azospirillaceae bacterium]|nr:hypothetical protein [Azospirillaceae bacterium]